MVTKVVSTRVDETLAKAFEAKAKAENTSANKLLMQWINDFMGGVTPVDKVVDSSIQDAVDKAVDSRIQDLRIELLEAIATAKKSHLRLVEKKVAA